MRLPTLATLLDAATRLPGDTASARIRSSGLRPASATRFRWRSRPLPPTRPVASGVPANKVWRIVGNVVIDGLVGAVPVLGDIFDVALKSNIRNLRIIEEHLGQRGRWVTTSP
jgi:uncharacterized protein DUF4112